MRQVTQFLVPTPHDLAPRILDCPWLGFAWQTKQFLS